MRQLAGRRFKLGVDQTMQAHVLAVPGAERGIGRQQASQLVEFGVGDRTVEHRIDQPLGRRAGTG